FDVDAELGACRLAVVQQALLELRIDPCARDEPGAPVGKILFELLHPARHLLRGDDALRLEELLHRPAHDLVFPGRAVVVLVDRSMRLVAVVVLMSLSSGVVVELVAVAHVVLPAGSGFHAGSSQCSKISISMMSRSGPR